MWGGRFKSRPDPIMEDINASIEFDRHLYRQDCLLLPLPSQKRGTCL